MSQFEKRLPCVMNSKIKLKWTECDVPCLALHWHNWQLCNACWTSFPIITRFLDLLNWSTIYCGLESIWVNDHFCDHFTLISVIIVIRVSQFDSGLTIWFSVSFNFIERFPFCVIWKYVCQYVTCVKVGTWKKLSSLEGSLGKNTIIIIMTEPSLFCLSASFGIKWWFKMMRLQT